MFLFEEYLCYNDSIRKKIVEQEMNESKHKHFTMGSGTDFTYVGCWFPITGKNKNLFNSFAQSVEEERPQSCKDICDHCGTKIVYHHIIRDSNGEEFAVGSECIKKLNDVKLSAISEKEEKKKIKETKGQIRTLLDEEERKINNGLTNKEVKQKKLEELNVEIKEKRKTIASEILSLISSFRMNGNKKKPLWQYKDTAELRLMLIDPKFIPNEPFIKGLLYQIEFYFDINVIKKDPILLDEKMKEMNLAIEEFNSELVKLETIMNDKSISIKKKYK